MGLPSTDDQRRATRPSRGVARDPIRPELQGPGRRWQARVIRGIRTGDPGALAELYDHVGGLVYRWALQTTGNRRHAEQVTTAVFTACWRDPYALPVRWTPLIGRLAALTLHEARLRPIHGPRGTTP